MNRLAVAVLFVAAAASCQRNLDMPPVPDTVPLSISPAFITLAPRETQPFSGVGGDGSYAFAFAQGGKLSGANATIDPVTGAYQAGGDGSALDVIEVTDGIGATATASISVGPRIAISPLSPGATPGGRITFSASGGSGDYSYSLEVAESGADASIDPITGTYTAGSSGPASDTIKVTDATEAVATTSVSVSSALRIYRAETRNLAPHESVTLVAIGGRPNYAFDVLLAASGAGATVDPVNGTFTAGNRLAPDEGTGVVYDLVRVTDQADVAQSATITIPVGPRLSLALPSSEIHAGESAQLLASGGKPPYLFGFAQRVPPGAGSRDPTRAAGGNGGNRSGGAVNAVTGTYAPGPSPGAIDFFQVTDSVGAPAAIAQGPRVGGRQLAIGNGVNGCAGLNVDADGSGDVAFFGRSGGGNTGGTESAKITIASRLATATPELQPYYATGWSSKVGAHTVADFTGTGRDRILALGGSYPCSSSGGWCSRDIWAAVPDIAGILSLEQVLGGPTGSLNVQNGAGYLDVASGTWSFFASGQTQSGCPLGAAYVDGNVIGFSWARATPAPTAPACYKIPGLCTYCSSSTWASPAAFAVGDFLGDANLDVALILSTDNQGQTASGANALLQVAVGNGTTTFPTPIANWPSGYSFTSDWNESGQAKFVVARAPTGAASVKDAIIVRLIDPTGRPKLFIVRTPANAAAWTIGTGPNFGFDPNPGEAGVDGVIALNPNTVPSGTRTYFASWSGTDGIVSGFAIDWSTVLPTFVANPAPLATFPFAVTAACFSDVNTDGTADLVAASDWGATAGIVLGDGTDSSAASGGAAFGGRTHLGGIEFPIAAGDLDGDGFVDAAVAQPGRGMAVMWGGGGQLAWGPQVTSEAVGAATIGDFTGDGKQSVFYQEKSGKFGLVSFNGGGSDAYSVTSGIPGVIAANTGPAGSYFLIWPADFGTTTLGGDALTFSGGDGSYISALLLQPGRVVDVRAQTVPTPTSHGQRDCWPVAVGAVPVVVAACSFRANVNANPVDSVAIFTAPLLNPNAAPGPTAAPAFGAWTQISPALVTPLTFPTPTMTAVPIWAPDGTTAASVAAGGVIPNGAGQGTAVFIVNTDRLYAVEVSGQLESGNWTWNAPAAYPIDATALTGRAAATGSPFLATMGKLDATADRFIVATGGDGMMVIRRTKVGVSPPTYTLTQRLGGGLFPIGIGPLQAGSYGDMIGFMGNFDGMGVMPELVPLLNDGTGKLH